MLRIKYSHKRKNIPYHDFSPIFCDDKFHSGETMLWDALQHSEQKTFHHYLDISGGGGGALSKGGVGCSITASAWDEAEAGTGCVKRMVHGGRTCQICHWRATRKGNSKTVGGLRQAIKVAGGGSTNFWLA